MNTFYRILIILACAIVGYLFGSIPNGVIFSKTKYKKDVRDYGSHNSGGTNTGRVFGKAAGLIVIILDILKILIPFALAIYLFEYNLPIKKFMNPTFFTLNTFGEGNTLNQLCYYIVPLAGTIGHSFSIFLHFKGGKIVSVYSALTIGTEWYALPLFLPIFLIILKVKKYVSLSSIITSGVVMIVNVAIFITYLGTFKVYEFNIVNYLMRFNFGPKCSIYLPLFTVLAWLFLVYRHKDNIKRLIDGTENKIKWMK